MEKKVFLHIGTPKTGSTAIQSALRNYDDGRIRYADFSYDNHSRPMFTAFSPVDGSHPDWRNRGYRELEIKRERERYRKRLSSILSCNDREGIVISAELLVALRSPDKIELIDFIKEHGWRPIIVCYVRSPLSLAPSLFSELVKHRLGSVPSKLSPNYREALEIFSTLVPPSDIRVRSFDSKKLFDGNVVKDFCKLIGANGRISGEISENTSLSSDAVRLLFNFNRSGVLSSGDPLIDKAHWKLVKVLERIYVNTEKLSPSLFESLADYSETDWLKNNFGIDFRSQPARSRESSLQNKLDNLADVDLGPIDRALEEFELKPDNFQTPVHKLHRLFYIMLLQAHATEIKRTKSISRRVRKWFNSDNLMP